MNYLTKTAFTGRVLPQRLLTLAFLLLAAQVICVFGLEPNPEITTSEDQMTVIVNDAPDQDIIVFGKSIIIKKRAKSALAVGGDVSVEGTVAEDVATIGGNVTQKDNSHIGGDVFVVGGVYKQEGENSTRVPGKETITFGVFEEELRNFGQNPSQLFSPTLSISFIAQRVVVALFWFIISIVFTTLAPGAVGRAVARIQLSFLKVCALGAGAFLFVMSAIIAGLLLLPNYLGATLGLMGMLLLVLGYVFGRVSLQVSFGKMIQKYLLSENNRSETLATLLGVAVWTLLLSLPYVWVIALFSVFAFGIGLILTGRSTAKWQNA